jgi:membrane protease YdiL (CAAX protease family)
MGARKTGFSPKSIVPIFTNRLFSILACKSIKPFKNLVMALKARFSEFENWRKLIVVGILLILSVFVAATVAWIEAALFGMNPLVHLEDALRSPNQGHLPFLRVMQLSQHVIVFLLPPLFAAYMFAHSVKKYFGFYFPKDIVWYLLVPISLVAILPFVNLLAYWNLQLELPASWFKLENWMQQKETDASNLIQLFFIRDDMQTLLINVFILAIVPAFAEEFLFRGIIQKLFTNKLNAHVAVWITAILFSAIHLQFYGFLPRMILGALLGYLYLYTRNIWAPIIAHFVNNFIAVLVMQYSSLENQTIFETVGQPSSYLWLAPLSLIATIYILRNLGMRSKAQF